MSSKSSRSKPRSKPDKPYEGYPMFAHPSGQWAKKVRGKLVYFGSWRSDPKGEAALIEFNRSWPWVKDGKTPPAIDVSDGLTIRQLCNEFLKSKKTKVDEGDMSPRTFRDYYKTCEGLIAYFGKDRRVDDLRPEDFAPFRKKLAKRLSVTSLKNERNRISIVFNFADDNKLIDKPVSFGQHFAPPSAKVLRRSRNEAGPKLFEREELLRILDVVEGKEVETGRTDEKTGKPETVKLRVDPVLKAMILLGLNCGFGNTDIGLLPRKAVDLDKGWIDFPRPKTEIPRHIPLWTETIDALKVALTIRPKPSDPTADGLYFLTRLGRPWVRVKLKEKGKQETQKEEDKEEVGPEASVPIDALSGQFGKLLHNLNINGRRGLGFYTLRHCFETYAGESKDQVAVDAIMGHVDPSMAANYRHRISDERLRAVVDTVRTWLYPPSAKEDVKGGEA